jgi:4-hydroxybenzoate polyprenyltransferase
MKKLLDHIFFLRPMLILPVWTIAILGVRAADVREMASPVSVADIQAVLPDVLLMLLLTGLLYGAIYIYNQIHDIESDRQNKKLFFLTDRIISFNSAYVLVTVLNAVSVIGAFLVNITLGVLFLIVAVLGILYSHPKVNYKGRAGKALWSNMFGCGMVPFLIGWAFFEGSISMEAVLKSLPYMLAVGAIYFNTTLPDREGDKKVGKKTYGVIWTVQHCQASALARLAFAILFAFMAGDYAVLIAAGLSSILFIKAYSSQQISDSVAATQAAILLLMIMACIYFPIFVIIASGSLLATRAYYKWRFDLAYPKLK